MKDILILICFLIVFFPDTYAQISKDEFCAANESNNTNIKNKPWYGNNKFLEEFLETLGYQDNTEKILFKVPVKFWVFRRSDGTGGISDLEIKEFINNLNYYYSSNKTGFRFYLRPDIQYVKKTRLYRFSYYRNAPFQIIKRRSKGCINILIPRNLTKHKLVGKDKHFNGTYNSIFKTIIVRQVGATATMSHEIGHYFGLEHPHRNCNKGKRKQESVSRTRKVKGLFRKGLNCEMNGDAIADTPAEPDLNKYSNDECEYTGQKIKDNWGDSYKPDINNIMSYTANRECRKVFTKGQIAVMLKTASENKYASAWSTGTQGSEKYDFDNFEPDNSKNAATEIIFNTSQYHTFHNVFAGNKKDFKDNTDWLFFKIKKPANKNIELKISKGKYSLTDLKISIFNNQKFIKELIVRKSDVRNLNLGKLSKGTYFLKIESLKKNNSISGYEIEIL